MPTTPYAKLLASINAGPPTDGAIVAANGDTVQFTAESTAQWDLTTPPRWEIFAFPPGWTGPAAGWTTESVPQPGGGNADIYVYTGLGPPPSFTLPALPMWGDFLCKLTVQGGLLNGASNPNLVDDRTALRIVGPGGLTDIAVGDSGQFNSAYSWVASWQNDLRILDAALVGGTIPYASTPEPIEVGAGSDGAVLEYSKGDHVHPVTVGIPTTIAIDTAASAGTGPALAASDHVHEVPPPTTVTTVALVGGIGVNPTFARDDHQHDLAFGVVNSLLGMATAPIDINGQTLTSGGFVGPYFSTSSTPTTTTGLLRGIASQVLVAARDDGNSNDVSILAWGVDGTDIVKVGDTFAVCLKLSVASGADVRMLDNNVTVWAASKANGFVFSDGSNASITYGAAATGANGQSIEFSAQDGAATFNGGDITIKAGAAGAGGASSGSVVLDSGLTGTASGLVTFAADGTAFLRSSYDTTATRTLVQAGGSIIRIDATTLELDNDNIAIFSGAGSFGGGTGVAHWTNASVEPTGDCTSGIRTWAYSGALKAKNYGLAVLAPQVESAPGSEDLRVQDKRAKRVSTSDATQTTAYTFAVPDNAVTFLKATVIAWTSDGGNSAGYEIRAVVKRFAGGNATLVGAVDVFTREDDVNLDATIDVNSTDARVRITGVAGVDYEWLVHLEATLMQPA